MKLVRLDAELVRRSLARSRAQAAELIEAGQVSSNGNVLTKAATRIPTSAPLVVRVSENDPGYASRGAHKLAGALEILGPSAPQISGRDCLDAGASTGGFTDVLLRRGAARVIAADVGYGQLDWRLQQDKRVIVMDRTNIRYLKSEDLPYRPELIVGDLSFISLTLIIPALSQVLAAGGEMLLMVKPQFEVGKERLGAGGVVRDPKLHLEAVMQVITSGIENGLEAHEIAASPLPGPAGNVEYFVHFKQAEAPIHSTGEEKMPHARGDVELAEETAIRARIERAIAEGPACKQ